MVVLRRRLCRRVIATLWCLGALSLTLSVGDAQPAAAASTRPNVVILITDDQRWDKVTPAYTPRIWDRLVDTPGDALHPDATSVAFSNAFVPSPLCCPSRASTLTGDYSHTTGVWGNRGLYGGFGAFDDKHTIAVDFNNAGYRTAMIGKYLNGYMGGKDSYVPPGWDRWFATNSGAYYNYGVTASIRYSSISAARWDGKLLHYGRRASRDYVTNVLSQRALRFVEDAKTAGKPFFLYYSFTAPHYPAIPDPRDIGRFEGEPDASRDGQPNSSMLESAYGVDRAVGKLLNVLPTSTIVVYLSDNGLLWGEHGATGKIPPYNESIRIPMVLASLDSTYVPPVGAHDLVLNVDLRPTLTRAARVPMLTRAEGLNWGGSGYVPRSRLVLELRDITAEAVVSYCGVREPGWTYARYVTGEELLFYDAADPLQWTNLIPQVATDAAVAAKDEQLRADAEDLCDPTPPRYNR